MMLFWKTLCDIVDVNTYPWIVKAGMGTTRDHPTNQFDISIKLSANYVLALTCMSGLSLVTSIISEESTLYSTSTLSSSKYCSSERSSSRANCFA